MAALRNLAGLIAQRVMSARRLLGLVLLRPSLRLRDRGHGGLGWDFLRLGSVAVHVCLVVRGREVLGGSRGVNGSRTFDATHQMLAEPNLQAIVQCAQ
jgi:hypothetical protein